MTFWGDRDGDGDGTGTDGLMDRQSFLGKYHFRYLLTMQHIGNLEHKFSISARYCHFSLLAWSKMKFFDILHNTKE